MKSKAILSILICLFSLTAKSQKQDFNFPLGYITPNTPFTDSIWGISFLNFDSPDGNPTISRNTNMILNLTGTNAPLSNNNGILLFIYDGHRILDGGNNWMANGSLISNTATGSVFQNGIALPMPGHSTQYILLHADVSLLETSADTTIYTTKLLYTLISFPPGGGFGQVDSKRNLVHTDTFDGGHLTAVRHANGRDWWMLLSKSNSDTYYAFLVTPEGVHLAHQQNVPGVQNFSAFGQAMFSPDGSRLAVLRSGSISYDTYVDMLDFDRCTGLLSNFRQAIIPGISLGVGLSFSPNSRFLYVSLLKNLYQLDMTASVLDTIIADTWDGFLYTYPGTSWSVGSTYGPMVNGPDGRIYSINYTNGYKYLNLIENPNLPVPYCNPRQHALEMPTLTGGPPNFAHYRLGPVDGSSCDSLGIDNIPWAWWRYEQDTALYGTIYFTDLSAYEPTQWQWDFGDGIFSADTSPVHAYAAPGIYTVCLIVSNAYGADTLCRTIHIATVPAQTTPATPAVELTMLPNPFRETLTLQWAGTYLPERAMCRLYDTAGRPVLESRVYAGWNTLNLSALPAGVYIWSVSDGGWLLGNGKVVRLE